MTQKNESKNEDKQKTSALNYDSILRYDTEFGKYKLLTISDKMIKNVNITLKDNILEIGGGTGELTLKYSDYVQNVIVTDINPYMIKIIQQKARQRKNISYALADALKIPFKDNSFNIVLERVLSLLSWDKFISDGTAIKVLKEMKRVSNDKIIIIHQNNSPFLKKKEQAIYRFNADELRRILENDLELTNVKVSYAVFSVPFICSLIGEEMSKMIEKSFGNNYISRKFGGMYYCMWFKDNLKRIKNFGSLLNYHLQFKILKKVPIVIR